MVIFGCMKWQSFHHPDLSLPVIRRKAGEELVSLLGGVAAMVLSRGASEIYAHCYPNRTAYHNSISRLKKKGLIIQSKTDGSMPELYLTREGKELLPPCFDPERYWDKKWNRWWYILMFDVPERDRAYRDTLRAFLKRERFGCLQRSVWVTPRDVRPEYDDLDRAAAVDSIAYLFEARTVLGYGNQSVVEGAWNFDRIHEVHQRYLSFAASNFSLLQDGDHTDGDLVELLRLEDQAYCQAMSIDPLLPSELLPDGYLGRQVYARHKELQRGIAGRLQKNRDYRKNSRS